MVRWLPPVSLQREMPSILTRPVMAMIARVMMLICRSVVGDTYGLRQNKSAKISGMGFSVMAAFRSEKLNPI